MGIKPNIILINCDDLGYGDLECYGSMLNHTPCINYMAENGLKLTDFYMASPVCSPSRGGMLTGCYPPRIGFGEFEGEWVLFPGQGVGLSQGEETIARVLKRAGYATKIVGKWHCGDQPEFLPTRHGFDSWYGLPYSNDMGVQNGNQGHEFARRETFPPLPLMDNEQIIQQQPDLASLTERYTENAIHFIRDNAGAGKPFFLYFAHMLVHRPLYVQNCFLKQGRNGLFGAAVECIDWSTQVLLHELKQLGILENTLVVFTSDNGSRGKADEGCSNLPLRGAKTTTWEGGQRVPCIFYWPGHIEAGRVSGEILASIDFLPSLAYLAGEKLISNNIIDGIDASGFLFENQEKSPRNTFIYYRINELQAVRKDDFKLHITRDGEKLKELYNLNEDISEQNNVFEKYPEIVEQLRKIAEDYRVQLGDSAFGITGKEIRVIGKVENPRMLTHYDYSHPYLMAMYDSEDCG